MAPDGGPGRGFTLFVRSYRLLGALATLVAISYEIGHELPHPDFYLSNFFSYFTELSNLFAAAVLLYMGLRGERRRSERIELVRGAAVLYMLTTGIVYAVLLSGSQASLEWVNTIVHRVMPAVVTLDWLLDPPALDLVALRARAWLAFPVVYFAYTLIRGAIVNWYPYEFLDPRLSGGYPRVLANGLGIAIGQILMGLLIIYSARRARALRPSRA